MAQTQFFKRENSHLDTYKRDFKITLEKVKLIKLFPEEVVEFFEKWIKSIESYIPRDDVDNFWWHIEKIFKEEECYKYILEELKTIRNNWKIQEYSFNLLSQLDESMKKYSKYKAEKVREESLNKSKENSRKEDEEKMDDIMWKLNDL